MAVTAYGGVAKHAELAGLGDDTHPQYVRWSQGTLAERPAAGRAGRQYRASDTGMTYYDLGTSWVEAVTLPSTIMLSTGATMTGPLQVDVAMPLTGTAGVAPLRVGPGSVMLGHPNGTAYVANNAYYDGTTWRSVFNSGVGPASLLQVGGNLSYYTSSTGTVTAAGQAQSWVERFQVDSNGSIYPRRGSASGGGLTNIGTSYRGGLHFQPVSWQPGEQVGITFAGQESSSNSNSRTDTQAAILVESNGGFGTKMNFYTTDSYAIGPVRALEITHNGQFIAGRPYAMMKFGPNQSWGASLVVGGNGTSAATGVASVCTTDGNLHLDAATNKSIHLGWYGGSGYGGTKFGNGASGEVASVANNGSMFIRGVEVSRAVRGSYTGNGTNTRHIALGFQPRVIFIQNPNWMYLHVGFHTDGLSQPQNPNYGWYWQNGNLYYSNSTGYRPYLQYDGFYVDSSVLNNNGTVYHYYALG